MRAQLYTLQNNVLVEVNESTGVVTSTGIVLPEATFVYLDGTAADPISRRIFLFADNLYLGHSVLITINLATSVLSQVDIPNVGSRGYDPTTQLLYGAQASGIVSINPATGIVTPLDIPVLLAPLSSVASAYDPVGRRMFIVGDIKSFGQPTETSTLATISLATSTATHVTIPRHPVVLEYDRSTQLLYGVNADNHVVSINPVTGAVSPVQISGLTAFVTQGESSFDGTRRRIFTYARQPTGDSVIETISLSTLTANQVFAPRSTVPTSVMLVFVEPQSIPVASLQMLALLVVALALAGTVSSGKATPFGSS